MSGQSAASLENIEPKEVFSKFLELTRIPHGSGNEKALSDYLRDWAKQKGFDVKQDASHNLLIAKPGHGAAANAPTVIIQAHLDMVCAKNPDYDFDFTKQPIQTLVDGDKLRAHQTTLGADDGIGVAFALALLDSDSLPHPPLEVALTTGEEVGLLGAAAFDAAWLKGSMLVNIDSEQEGTFYTSCAGGGRVDITFKAESAPLSAAAETDCVAVKVSNLRGGHSGVEIDKERGNSHRLMGRALRSVFDAHPGTLLADIRGGQADNAIPTATEAVLLIPKNDRGAVEQLLAEWQETFRRELRYSDGKPGADGKAYEVAVAVTDAPRPANVLSAATAEKILLALLIIPTGVAAMNFSNPEQILPESSSNLAVVAIADGVVNIRTSIRSAVESKKAFLLAQLTAVARALGGEISVSGAYPGWEYDPDSRLRPLFVKIFEKQTGKKAVVVGVHAGLECGLFAAKMKALGKTIDCTSIGPDLRDVHTPDENLGISSTGRTWEMLKEVMATLAKEGVQS